MHTRRVLRAIGVIYVTVLPAILGAVLNMVWVRTPVLTCWARPIDKGRTLRDGRRLLGDNKTWKGLVGVTVLSGLSGLAWGAVLRGSSLEPYNLLFVEHPSTPGWAALTGTLLGLAYGLFELPNSWLKRRVGIRPGRTRQGRWAWVFVLLDQVDSVLGCAVVLALLAPVSAGTFLGVVLVGAVTHFLLNLVLYQLRLRSSPL